MIAQAIVAAARERGLALSLPSEVEERPGAGVIGIVNQRRVVIGGYGFVTLFAVPADWSAQFLQRMGYEGAPGVFVAIDGVVAGALLLVDEIRLETPRALRLLRKAGIERIVMLTGDRRDVAETVGALLGVDQVLAEQQPQDKLAAIKASQPSGATIMVGDGVNDAPALAAADVGVAMGERGAAASSEAADVVLLVDRLDRPADALRIAIRSRAIAVESVVIGMGLSIAAMAFAAFGFLPPLAVGPPGSDRHCRNLERIARPSRPRGAAGPPGAHSGGGGRSQARSRRAEADSGAGPKHGGPAGDATP